MSTNQKQTTNAKTAANELAEYEIGELNDEGFLREELQAVKQRLDELDPDGDETVVVSLSRKRRGLSALLTRTENNQYGSSVTRKALPGVIEQHALGDPEAALAAISETELAAIKETLWRAQLLDERMPERANALRATVAMTLDIDSDDVEVLERHGVSPFAADEELDEPP